VRGERRGDLLDADLAPVPANRGGQQSSACKFVLVGLANHAGPDGTGAFPSVATLVRYTGLSERTVRTCLDRLAAEGIIAPCDPGIVAAWIQRADLDDAAVAVLEHQFPGLGIRLAVTAQPGADGQSDGVQSPRPVATGQAVDNRPNGCSDCTRTGQGTAPGTRRPARMAPDAAETAGGGLASEFFVALGVDWQLTAAQRARLSPAAPRRCMSAGLVVG
jgi:hypothetical protein